MPLVEFTDEGLYCPPADLFIDPWQPVKRAIITHAHADHARWGHKHYLAHTDSEYIMRYRLGEHISLQTLPYGQKINVRGVEISLHPAGHIIGSAQVKLSYRGESWVVSGDYKLGDDHFCTPFEPVPCHTFITESTFGLPVYRWKPQEEIIKEIESWWQLNQDNGKTSILSAYSLGKAQRVLSQIRTEIGPVLLHGAVYNTNQALMRGSVNLPDLPKVYADTDKQTLRKALIVAPPSALNSPWINRFRPFSTGIASGWMNIRGMKRRRAADRGFTLSDHADWDELNLAVEACGAERVYVTHGYTAVFSRWLKEKGLEAYEVKTLYEGESAELNPSTDTED
ncbi:MAG: ligase-associated DNA damage response exonuclease [Cyclobacteriaceae bacterium]